MKIFAVLHNYGEQQKQDSVFGEGEPIWYELADSSLLKNGNPFFIPDFDSRFTAYPSIVYRIGRLGKSISVKFAPRYLEAAGMAVAIVAEDNLSSLRRSGMPWTDAVSFDRSCLLGNLQPIHTLMNKTVEVSCGENRMIYRPDALRHSIEEIVALISRRNTLKNGDLILAGLTPEGFPLFQGAKLTCRLELSNTNILDINIR